MAELERICGAIQTLGVIDRHRPTGALVAAERNNRRMWALHVGYLAEEVIPGCLPILMLQPRVPAVPWRAWPGRTGVAPMSSVAPRRPTECEQLLPRTQRRWSEVRSTAGSPSPVIRAVP